MTALGLPQRRTQSTGKLLGFAYGVKSIADAKWNTLLRELISDEWVTDCFEFMDLCVAPEALGLGLGSRLMGDTFKYVTTRSSTFDQHG